MSAHHDGEVEARPVTRIDAVMDAINQAENRLFDAINELEARLASYRRASDTPPTLASGEQAKPVSASSEFAGRLYDRADMLNQASDRLRALLDTIDL